MDSIQALLALLCVFALGEIVAEKTKAYISTTLVIALALLAAFWLGLPKDIFAVAEINRIAMVLIGILITGLGTMMDLPEFKRQWKTVVIGCAAVVAATALIILVCPLFIGRDMAIGGAPIFAGANVATLVMTNALREKGAHTVASFCVLLLVTQNFIGIPYASFLLRKAAKSIRGTPELARYRAPEAETRSAAGRRKPLALPEIFCKPSGILAKLAAVAALSSFLAKLTGGVVHYFVAALIMGIVFMELGFLEKNALSKTASGGFIITATTLVIFTSLADTSPAQMLSLFGPLVLVLVTGAAGVTAVSIIAGKLLKVNGYLAVALGMTCTFGFPTTMLMSKEVAQAIGENDAERAALESYLLPKMICAGFITVTVLSVLIAGVVVKLL
ncbi:MAG: hypothetical protein LBC88_09760 [Spirochaetaceae bacterium]|jgi:hypothetical protein|nr:hypothetical protein [Spirochaetaceae bacterium]